MAEKRINGRTFRVEPMLATKAIVLQARILKLLGPAMSKLGDVMKGHGDDKTAEQKEASNAAAMAAISEIFNRIEPESVAELMRDVVEVAQIKRESGTYDQCDLDGDFTNHQGDIIPVVVFVLREQFGHFFTGMQGSGLLKGLTKV